MAVYKIEQHAFFMSLLSCKMYTSSQNHDTTYGTAHEIVVPIAYAQSQCADAEGGPWGDVYV